MRTKFLPMLSVLMLIACSERSYDAAEPAEDQAEQTESPDASSSGLTPSAQPVRVGEGGPRFDACQAIGRVSGRSALDVLEAPFDSARQVDSLAEGQNVWICTRSIDQQWFGVVYDDAASGAMEGEGPASSGPGDCGVSSPVRTKQTYSGPCKSGWIESTFVRLIAS